MKKLIIKQGPFAGKECEVIRTFTSMLKGKQILVQIGDRQVWINASDLED